MSQILLLRCTNSGRRAITAQAQSRAMSKLRRSKRSARAPPIGASSTRGSTEAAIVTATSETCPVSWYVSTAIATVLHQVPTMERLAPTKKRTKGPCRHKRVVNKERLLTAALLQKDPTVDWAGRWSCCTSLQPAQIVHCFAAVCASVL